MDFLCMRPNLFLNLPAFLREKVAGENYVNVMKGGVAKLGNILKFFNKAGGISFIRPQYLFYLRKFVWLGGDMYPNKGRVKMHPSNFLQRENHGWVRPGRGR